MKRRTSLRLSPGAMKGHSIGMKATITVGIANTREKMKVLRHLRRVRLSLRLLWELPSLSIRASNPAF